MEAKECRLNNIVNYRGQITTLTKNEMVHFYRFSEFYGPIPLTEEILLKCGFEWSIQHQSYKHKNFKYVIDFYNSHPQFNSSVCFLNKEHRSGENLICIHYLHQLQNLYFALTNEELTVNL